MGLNQYILFLIMLKDGLKIDYLSQIDSINVL